MHKDYLGILEEYIKLNSVEYKVSLKVLCEKWYNYINNGLKDDSLDLYKKYKSCSRYAYRGRRRERLLSILDSVVKKYIDGDNINELLLK